MAKRFDFSGELTVACVTESESLGSVRAPGWVCLDAEAATAQSRGAAHFEYPHVLRATLPRPRWVICCGCTVEIMFTNLRGENTRYATLYLQWEDDSEMALKSDSGI